MMPRDILGDVTTTGSGLFKSPFIAGLSWQPALPIGNNISRNNNDCTAIPFIPGRTGTISAMRISIQTVTGAGGVYRLGVYNYDTTTSKPSTLVADAGTISGTAATGVQAATGLSIGLTTDIIYFLVCVQQGAASNGTLKGYSNVGAHPLLPMDPTNLSTGAGWVNNTGMSGSLPASTPAADWSVAGSSYAIQLLAA